MWWQSNSISTFLSRSSYTWQICTEGLLKKNQEKDLKLNGDLYYFYILPLCLSSHNFCKLLFHFSSLSCTRSLNCLHLCKLLGLLSSLFGCYAIQHFWISWRNRSIHLSIVCFWICTHLFHIFIHCPKPTQSWCSPISSSLDSLSLFQYINVISSLEAEGKLLL